MSFSDFLENELLDHLFGQGVYTPPTVYVGLSTADPGDDGATLAEPVGNGYARVATEAADWLAASLGAISNQLAITFPEASDAWGTITYFALFDAATSGNLLGSGVLTAPVAPVAGETPQFAAGDLDVSIT